MNGPIYNFFYTRPVGELMFILWIVMALAEIFLSLLKLVINIISNYFILKKAGEEPWKAFIPYYGFYTVCDISCNRTTTIVMTVIKVASYFLGFIPLLQMLPYVNKRVQALAVAKSFGKDTTFLILACIFPNIIKAVIAFSKCTYTEDKLILIPDNQ